MKFFKEPKQFEEEEWEHLVIGYFHGKAIVKDENGQDVYKRQVSGGRNFIKRMGKILRL